MISDRYASKDSAKGSNRETAGQYRFDREDQSQIDFMNQQALHFEQQRDKSILEENETERAMCGQLMLLTTVSFSGAIVLVGNGDVIARFTNAQKILICLAVVMLAISMFAGIRYYKKLIAFHRLWVEGNHEVTNLFTSWAFDSPHTIAPTVNNRLQSIPIETSKKWSKWQEVALWSSFAVYFILLIAIFFDFSRWTSSLPVVIR